VRLTGIMQAFGVMSGVLLTSAALAQPAAARPTTATPAVQATQATPPPAPAAAPAPTPAAPLTDEAIRQILAKRIDTDRQSVGIVAGLIDAKGRRVVAYGRAAAGDTRPLTGQSIYEIGSITKVFTSLLLADMVNRGEVALTDPVSKLLPADVKVPERNGRAITLQDLAMHVSGLPRMPSNFAPRDKTNPYADYTNTEMFAFLSGYTLTRDIGSQYEYSNFGAGLLGQALARRAGMDYETLVRTRITGPLRMTNTSAALTPDMRARFVTGHDNSMTATPYWDFPAGGGGLAAAGALRSDVDDMLTFLGANLGFTPSPLSSAMTSMVTPRHGAGRPNVEVALGWHVTTRNGKEIVWHNGGTGGFRTFAGYDRKAGIGVVVLSNAATPIGADDIGMHLIDPSAPLATPPAPQKPRTQITVDPKLFDGYVGRYELGPNAVIAVTREADRLFVQLTGQPRFEVFAEGERDFFLKVVDAQITFEADPQGRATQLVLHQNGMHQPAKRIE